MGKAEIIPLTIRCASCGKPFAPDRYRRLCPNCDPEYAPALLVVALSMLSVYGWIVLVQWIVARLV